MQEATDDKILYSGLIRLHILHHAAKEPIYGLWMVEELQRHGYKLSTGTLYPILHGMETKGYLQSHIERDGKTSRRIYQSTTLGKRALKSALGKVRELFRELVEEHSDHKKITRPKHARK
ncbi:MAG TPA: PadR family transcriptional regulator [Bryobacteraceae bacterium]|nr:PadR family transcriptional regulator [Bryobacteraceae bacterium]